MRQFLVFIHRWAGLAMAGFLIVVGLTGSLLAFKGELEHLISPQLFAMPKPGAAPLDLAAIADKAEVLVPHAKVIGISFAEPDRVTVSMSRRKDDGGMPFVLGFDQLFLDPCTGDELGRRTWGDISQGWVNLIPFVYRLHYALAFDMTGLWILGVVALVWTIDCFVGFYLTLPANTHGFWRRWKLAWQIKGGAGAFRLNFDVHRAVGLWVWPMLLIFAWSSVYMNLRDTVYTWSTRVVLDFRPTWTEIANLPEPRENPGLDFQAALARGERLMAEQARLNEFTVGRPLALGYQPARGVYRYGVRSSRDIADEAGWTAVYFDGETGSLRWLELPAGQYSGNTVTSWLAALHMARIFGLPYRIFVCTFGLIVAMLSATGIYIWWKKRSARRASRRPRVASVHEEVQQEAGLASGSRVERSR
jgi:uncharacterized iron-regulated membrane protein